MIEQFLSYLRGEKRYSSHTIRAYRGDLYGFFDYLKNNYQEDNPLRVTPQHIRSWMAEQSEQNVSSRTIRRRLSSLSAFYRYLQKKQMIEVNPVRKITVPKVTSSLPEFIRDADLVEFLDNFQTGEDLILFRDKLIISLLFNTGIRRSELVGITLDDLQLPLIKIKGKRQKERLVPLSDPVLALLQDYLEKRRTFLESQGLSTSALFISEKGVGIYPEMVYRIVKKYLHQARFVRKNHPHVLRHSFATTMLNHGADIVHVKEILGHSNLNATQVYTHLTNENLKSVYLQYHPRAKLSGGKEYAN